MYVLYVYIDQIFNIDKHLSRDSATIECKNLYEKFLIELDKRDAILTARFYAFSEDRKDYSIAHMYEENDETNKLIKEVSLKLGSLNIFF